MTERDYAAPLNQERRESIWAKLTFRLSRRIDWDSAPLLTPALREQFPDLLNSQPTLHDTPPVPPISEALRSDYYASRPGVQRHSRSDSAQGDIWYQFPARDTQTVSRNRDLPQRPGSHRSSHGPPSQSTSHQQTQRQQDTEQETAILRRALVQFRSPLWFAESDEGPRSVPTTTPPAHSSSPPLSYRQHNTDNAIYQRDSQGCLFAVANTERCRIQEQTIRRRPAVQSSLRNQVAQEYGDHSGDGDRSGNGSIDHGTTGVTSSNHRNTATTHGGYSYYPLFSPPPSTSPHALPHPSRSSSAHRLALATHPNIPPSPRSPRSPLQTPSPRTTGSLQVPPRSPPSTPLSLQELQELEGSLRYDPPAIPHPPFVQHHDQGSSSSVATFENRNPSSAPLSSFQAQLAGLKRAILSPHYLKAGAVQLAKRIAPKSREMWRRSVSWKDRTRTRIDVAAFGPQVGCWCGVCVRKRGGDLEDANEVAHYVPDVTRPRAEIMPHESGYGRLLFWEFAPRCERGE